jgi:predicted nucleotidyltransferase
MDTTLRDSILQKLRDDRDELRRFGVRAISIFGSVARGDWRPKSDVDVLVDLDDDVSILGMARIARHLEELLGRRVDLVDVEGLRPQYRDEILAEAIRAA